MLIEDGTYFQNIYCLTLFFFPSIFLVVLQYKEILGKGAFKRVYPSLF